MSVLMWLFWLWVPPAKAPEASLKPIYILEQKALHPWGVDDPILEAFIWFESRWEPDAKNKVTGARGILQILPSMIDEVNRILLKEYKIKWLKYTWKDAWDPEKSIEIWYLVQTYHNPDYDVQRACQIWFGMGTQWDGMTWVEYFIGLSDKLKLIT